MQAEAADPATGLTPTEKSLVQKSWAALAGQWKTLGPDFFIYLFQENPKIRAHFTVFDGMNEDEMRKSPKLKAHVLNFKLGLASFVDSLDEPEILVILIQKMSTNHHRRSIDVERFKESFESLMKFVEIKAPLDPTTKAAWNKTLDVVASVIGEAMAKLQKE